MLKKYLFVVFNIVVLMVIGYTLDLLGTADDVAVALGALSLVGIPFMYIYGLRVFGYYERCKKWVVHIKDLMNGNL